MNMHAISNVNEVLVPENAVVETAVSVRLMTIDELSMVGGGNDCATLG